MGIATVLRSNMGTLYNTWTTYPQGFVTRYFLIQRAKTSKAAAHNNPRATSILKMIESHPSKPLNSSDLPQAFCIILYCATFELWWSCSQRCGLVLPYLGVYERLLYLDHQLSAVGTAYDIVSVLVVEHCISVAKWSLRNLLTSSLYVALHVQLVVVLG